MRKLMEKLTKAAACGLAMVGLLFTASANTPTVDDPMELSFGVLKGREWRFGLSFDSGVSLDRLSFRIPVMTNREWDSLFLGVMADYTLFNLGPVAFSVNAGWTANFNRPTRPTDGQWGWGASVTARF